MHLVQSIYSTFLACDLSCTAVSRNASPLAPKKIRLFSAYLLEWHTLLGICSGAIEPSSNRI